MRTDQDIALEASDRLHAIPGLDDQDIAVKVRDSLVLLAGIVRSDLEGAQAAQAVKEVRGVIGLTNCLAVCPRTTTVPPDPEITREAVAAIRHQFPEQWEMIRVLVRNGRTILEGQLDWYYQRDVVNRIRIRPMRLATL